MKTYYLKIREKFIGEINAGNKKHEYRLASPERTQVKVGDTLVLVSNQNKSVFVKTTVKGIKIFPGWREALADNWQQDFQNLYSTIDEALRECYKFYPKVEVDAYGIIVYEIEPLKTDILQSSILIDTNIIIKRESSNNATFEIASLFNWFTKKGSEIFVHKCSEEELSSHCDEVVRTNMLTKLKSYNTLPAFTHQPDDYFEAVISKYPKDQNGIIDNTLLREVYDGNVGILLTDDNLILRKAQELYIRDRVLTSAELLSWFETCDPHNIEYKMLAVTLSEFGDIDLNSSFFDTLREDYEGVVFDNWFKKKARNKEKAYIFKNESGMLQGFLYLKDEYENEPDYLKVTPPLAPKHRMKVGTFKIEQTGFRLGERFLKIIFDNARSRHVDEIYVTLFENKRDGVKRLKALMEEWGFRKHGYKPNGELVLVKTMEAYDSNESPKFNYPLLKSAPDCYFLPIYAQYHTDLFPDMILKNEDMHLYEDKKAHRYALEKIYLSGSYDAHANPGDLFVIYRIADQGYKKYSSVVTGIAIIESIIKTETADECVSICKNRSVFTEEEIREMHKTRPIVIKLLDYMPFTTKVTLDQLRAYGIVGKTSGPRPFNQISKEQFEIIYRLGMEV